MNFLRRARKRLVIILTTPINLRWLFWWRKKPKAEEEIVLDEPKDAGVEPEFLIPLLDLKKYSPGPRFVMERRRKAMMRAGKVPGVGPTA
jgi:hypothetical protein